MATNDDPTRCEVCGMFLTADAAYAGRRCCCEGSPLCLAYVELCSTCERVNGLDCQPERCERKIGEATSGIQV
jgi:hypothetical protein